MNDVEVDSCRLSKSWSSPGWTMSFIVRNCPAEATLHACEAFQENDLRRMSQNIKCLTADEGKTIS